MNTLTIPAELSPPMYEKSKALFSLHARLRKTEQVQARRDREDRDRDNALNRIATALAEHYPALAVKFDLADDDQLADAVVAALGDID